MGFDMGTGIGAAIGGIVGAGAGGQPAPIQQTQTFTPWNSSYWGPLQDNAQSLSSTNKLNLPTVPTLPGMPNIASDTAANNYANNVVNQMQVSWADPNGPLANIRGDFNAAQPGGGTRQALAEGIAAGREGQAEALARAQIMNAIYPTNLNYNAQAAAMNNANAQWQYGQGVNTATAQFQAPWQNLLNLSTILGTAGSKGGTTTSTTTLPKTSSAQTGIGGALMGSQIGRMIGGGKGIGDWFGFGGAGGYANAIPADGLFEGGGSAGEWGGMGLDSLIEGFMGEGAAGGAIEGLGEGAALMAV